MIGLVQCAVPQEGRDQIHDQRLPLLQFGADQQRRRRRRHCECVGEGVEDWLDGDEPQLGAKLAIQLGFCGPIALFPREGERSPELHLVEHCTGELAVWSDIRRQEFQSLIASPLS